MEPLIVYFSNLYNFKDGNDYELSNNYMKRVEKIILNDDSIYFGLRAIESAPQLKDHNSKAKIKARKRIVKLLRSCKIFYKMLQNKFREKI